MKMAITLVILATSACSNKSDTNGTTGDEVQIDKGSTYNFDVTKSESTYTESFNTTTNETSAYYSVYLEGHEKDSSKATHLSISYSGKPEEGKRYTAGANGDVNILLNAAVNATDYELVFTQLPSSQNGRRLKLTFFIDFSDRGNLRGNLKLKTKFVDKTVAN